MPNWNFLLAHFCVVHSLYLGCVQGWQSRVRDLPTSQSQPSLENDAASGDDASELTYQVSQQSEG
jgi:hypothetical protein